MKKSDEIAYKSKLRKEQKRNTPRWQRFADNAEFPYRFSSWWLERDKGDSLNSLKEERFKMLEAVRKGNDYSFSRYTRLVSGAGVATCSVGTNSGSYLEISSFEHGNQEARSGSKVWKWQSRFNNKLDKFLSTVKSNKSNCTCPVHGKVKDR